MIDFWDQTGKWQARPQKASITIEPDFHADRIQQITPEEQTETFRIRDAAGKVATLRHARASLFRGELLVDVDVKPIDLTKIGEVRGTVVDEKDQPVAGARVGVVANSVGTNDVTANDGRFSLRDYWSRKAGGRLSVVVIKDGFGTIQTRPVAAPEDPEVPIDFGRIVLRPGKSIRIRVLDEGGNPVVGAWVEPMSGPAASPGRDDRRTGRMRDPKSSRGQD